MEKVRLWIASWREDEGVLEEGPRGCKLDRCFEIMG